MNGVFEWEKPLVELERRIEELQALPKEGIDLSDEIATLERKAESLRRQYMPRSPAAHDHATKSVRLRSTTSGLIFDEFFELHGDRAVREDAAWSGHSPPRRPARYRNRPQKAEARKRISAATSGSRIRKDTARCAS